MNVPAVRASTALIRDLEEAGALTPTQLDLSGYPVTIELLEALATFFGELNDSTRWWIADLLNYTEMRYGEYVAHIAEFTGLAEQTIENYISIGRRVPPSRRRRGVKFSTHGEVAALSPNEQRHWLKIAADEKLKKMELRARLKPELPPAVVRTVTCPHCGGTVELSN